MSNVESTLIVIGQKVEIIGTVEHEGVEVVVQTHESSQPATSIFLVKLLLDYTFLYIKFTFIFKKLPMLTKFSNLLS